MIRCFKILLICLAFTSFVGCENKETETKGIKIGELAPAGGRIEPQVLRTTNISVIIYELAAENAKSLDDIWQTPPVSTDKEAFRYTDVAGFAANGLRAAKAGFGSIDKITAFLKSANAKELSTTTLLIQNGQVEVLRLGRQARKETISYIGRGGVIENAQVGPAIYGLQFYARQILPADRQTRGGQIASRVQVTPIIMASTEGLPTELAEKIKAKDLRIYSAGFGLNMKPGDYVLLAPSSDFIRDETTAAGRFFTRTGTNPVMRVLLIVCTSIN
jgi:hypothetical protein